MKIDETKPDSTFGTAIEYRHVFSSDSLGKHSEKDYSGSRSKNGYTLMRVAQAKRVAKESKENTQPYHRHEKRDLFIIGMKGKRTMKVEGKIYEIVPGTILYVEPGNAHKTVDIGKDEWTVLEFWLAQPHDTETFLPD